MKLLIALALSYLVTVGPAIAKDVIAPRPNEDINFIVTSGGQKKVAIKVDGSTGRIAYMVGHVSVGEIVQSILTEAQFQASMGVEWVQMIGQAVTGSKLCDDMSICTLPDARNKFFRSSDGVAALTMLPVPATTAKNGLDLYWNSSTANLVSTTAVWSSINTTASASTATWIGVSLYSNQANNANISHGDFAYATSSGYLASREGGTYNDFTWPNWPGRQHTHTVFNKNVMNSSYIDHNHYFNKNTLNSNQNSHGHTINKNMLNTVSIADGGDETAPEHIIVNSFIKIN